jgi:hypothetical protein
MTRKRRKRGDMIAAAVRLSRLIGPDECVLIGGLAVGVHGYVRGTDDLDLITRVPLSRTQQLLRAAGIETRILRGDIVEGGFDCLKGELEGIPFDVLPPLVPIAWGDAVTLDVDSMQVKVVDLDGLLALKFRAAGPQDLLDAVRLVLRHPEHEARARELARAYRTLDRFEVWLKDPRIRAQASEEEARAKRRGSPPRPTSAPKKPRKKSSRRPR